MAIGVGDLLQIVCEGDYLEQTCINVYYYRVTNIAAFVGVGLEIVADNFRDQVLPAVRNVQVSSYVHRLISVKDLTTGVDFYDLPIDLAGINTTPLENNTPSWLTIGFQLYRSSLATRNGYKRFSGLPEAWVTGNRWVGSPGSVEAIEAALLDPLNDGVNNYANPVIVKRPIPVPAAIGYAYSDVQDVQFKGLGSQNTRKP